MGSQDRPTLAPQDLSGDWTLRGAARVNHAGVSCPALGGWAILRRLGKGGMGVVYYGINPRLGTEVAVKLLPRDVQERHPAMVERFLQEARLAARLRSPHLVGVLDVDRDAGTGCYFLVMEYVHGVPASRWLESFSGRQPPGAPEARALDLTVAATRGLVVAHHAGIVHRDVKPDNILIPFDGNGMPDLSHSRLSDLGLARRDEGGQNLTESFVAMGTLGFAAPEQLQDVRAAQKAADVFAMGATLYALLSGRAPFARPLQVERIMATLALDFTPIRELRPDVSRGTADLLADTLRKEPAERPSDGAALLERLLRCRGELCESVPTITGEMIDVRSAEAGGAALRARGATPGSARGVRAASSRPAPPADALLTLESEPPGAEVRIDGVVVGVTPLAARPLTPGRHEVVLQAPDHTPSAFPIVAKPGEEIRIARVAMLRFGEIDLSEWPQDVVLESGGKVVHHGERVPPGKHAFRARRDGCLAARVEFEVPPGARSRPPTPALRRDPIRIADDVESWDGADDAEREAAATAVAGIEPGWRFLRLETFACGGTTRSVAVLLHERTGAEFALVPGGRYERGSPSSEPGRRTDEGLLGCAIGPSLVARTPVTTDAWQRVAAGSRDPVRSPTESAPGSRGALPVHALNWPDANDFCLRAGLRLPTEAEWEWAARAGGKGRWCFGDDEAALDQYAWSSRNSAFRVHPAGALAPNAFGLLDVHGNVAEWCADEYAEDPRFAPRDEPDAVEVSAPAPGDAPETRRYRSFRGGSFRDMPERLRSAARGAFRPEWHGAGLRPVRAVEAGLVDLSLVPSDAEVEVEGRVVTGSFVHLAPGAHVLTVRRPDADPVSVPVVVEPRQASAPALPEWPRGRAAATAAVLRDLESWEAASSEAREDAAREVARRIPGLAFAGTRWFDSGGRRFEMAILRHDATSIEMSLLPGGTFEMGSPPEEPGRAPAESLRTETVAAFLLARAPVSQAEWEKAMAANPSAHRGADLPVEQVSWLDAQEFCRRTGFSLPTEAQWEYACRAGTRSRFSFGDDEEDLARHAWFEANSGAVTHSAGTLQPNAFGLHDMHGNVWEWCADAWADYDGQRSETEGGAVREESQIRRVVRGGAWTTTPGYLRCAARLPFAAGARRTTIGLRPCLAVPEPAPGRSGSGSAAGGVR